VGLSPGLTLPPSGPSIGPKTDVGPQIRHLPDAAGWTLWGVSNMGPPGPPTQEET